MLSLPHCASAGGFWSSAATSEPTALASLVWTASQPVVVNPAGEGAPPVSVTEALLDTCQFGARSVVSPRATGERNAQAPPVATATAVTARARNLDPSTEFPFVGQTLFGRRRAHSFVAFPNKTAPYSLPASWSSASQ